MNITCPKCNFSKPVDPARVPDRPVKVNCPKCKAAFTFDKSAQAAQATAPARQVTCPACGLVQEEQEDCAGCGVNYERYSARLAEGLQVATGDNETGRGPTSPQGGTASYPSPESREKAGFWIRVVAAIIDSFLLSIVQFILTMMISLLVGALGIAAGDDPAVDLVIWLFGVTISLGYAVFFTGYCGQTPGKMAVRVKVIRTDGSEMSYGRAALREILGKFVSSILLGIGYLMVAFDSQKQGLHDKIADTYVIKL